MVPIRCVVCVWFLLLVVGCAAELPDEPVEMAREEAAQPPVEPVTVEAPAEATEKPEAKQALTPRDYGKWYNEFAEMHEGLVKARSGEGDLATWKRFIDASNEMFAIHQDIIDQTMNAGDRLLVGAPLGFLKAMHLDAYKRNERGYEISESQFLMYMEDLKKAAER